MKISDMAAELINKDILNEIKTSTKELPHDMVINLLTRVSLGHKATEEERTYIQKWYKEFCE